MTEKKRVLNIELTLNGQVKERFVEIKRTKDLTDDAEVLRLIINEYFEKKLVKGGETPGKSQLKQRIYCILKK